MAATPAIPGRITEKSPGALLPSSGRSFLGTSGVAWDFHGVPLFWEDGGTVDLRENRTETISLPPLQLAPRTGLAQAGCPSAVYRVAHTVGGGCRTLGRQGLVNFLHEASLSLQLNKQTRKIRTDV